jgi:hypothetical protein
VTSRRRPPEQLRAHLEVARKKGTPFRIAFSYALLHIEYPSEWEPAKQWRDALKDTRDEWEAAYLGMPPVVPGLATVASTLAVAA